VPPRSTPIGQLLTRNGAASIHPTTAESRPGGTQMIELGRLQELEIQRTLMPISHTSTSLLSAFTNSTIEPYVPSMNLRSYVALSRPGIGNVRRGQSNDLITPISREGLSAISGIFHRSFPIHDVRFSFISEKSFD
jgi:hypothetical protein